MKFLRRLVIRLIDEDRFRASVMELVEDRIKHQHVAVQNAIALRDNKIAQLEDEIHQATHNFPILISQHGKKITDSLARKAARRKTKKKHRAKK